MNEKNSQDSKEKKTRLNLGDRQLSSPGSPRKKTFGRGKFNVGSVVVVKKKRRSNSSASVSSFGAGTEWCCWTLKFKFGFAACKKGC